MWTRNYQNLINTVISCRIEAKSGATTSSNAFGDACCWNFKTPSGSVYNIGTFNAQSLDDNNYISRPSFVNNISGALYAAVNTLTGPTANASLDDTTIYVGFGSSGEAATFDDYKLHSHITSGYSTLSKTATPTLNTDGTITINYKIIISATTDLTIQEIGLFRSIIWKGTTGSGTYAYYALINRIVLDEPVSVAANQTSTITFSITTPKITLG